MSVRTIGGRYAIEGRLGEGGMGHVYRVRHPHLARQFALKVIAPAFAGDATARDRFNTEAQIASEISHPNLVSVVDFGEDPELGAYMVMELVEGEPLSFADASPPSVRRALDILSQVADALEHIHKRGVIHGDIKAQNLLLAEEPASGGSRRRRVVRLIDFGLAKRLGNQDTTLDGTPHYLAPERCTGGPATIASDIYALGVLGYLLLTRELPFQGTTAEILDAHVRQAPRSLAERRGEAVDEALETLIMRAMSKPPALRHASAAAFRYELNTVMHMLEIAQRRTKTTNALDRKTDAAATLFEKSKLAQVVVRADNSIKVANAAFAELVDKPLLSLKGLPMSDTPFIVWIVDLELRLDRVRSTQQPLSLRARCETGPLEIWLTPAAVHDEVHVLVQRIG